MTSLPSYLPTFTLFPKLLDLLLQSFKFSLLLPKKTISHLRFLFDTLGCEFIDVRCLIPGVLEVARLDQALVREGAEAVVGLAQGDAHLAREVALGELGIGFEGLEEVIIRCVVHYEVMSYVLKDEIDEV